MKPVVGIFAKLPDAKQAVQDLQAHGAAGRDISLLVPGASVDELRSVPKDEWFVYEDALRQGRTIIVALAGNGLRAESARDILLRHGAESVDSARERWWIGLRSAEEEHYAAGGGDFKSAEATFRRGFEAALHPESHGRSYESVLSHLWKQYPAEYSEKSFHDGYERGQQYWKAKQG